jgi:glycine/D-amino acid oxidase-like deaminating enzyme
MKTHTADVLIVGQGLAGSVLAATLMARGCVVHVLDDERAGGASRVAAGMFNPVSFRRIIPVWRADEVMRTMRQFYTAQEALLNAKFFHEVPLVKLFPNAEYRTLWEKRLAEGMPWIAPLESVPSKVNAPFGAGVVPTAGFVDLPVFLKGLALRLSADGRLHHLTFDTNHLTSSPQGVTYCKANEGWCIEAKQLVMATGAFALGSDLLGHLPLQHNKGEVLTVKLDAFTASMTLNNGKWLLPIGQGCYRLGASYAPGVSDHEPTAEVAAHLLEKLHAMADVKAEVLRHDAGVRPTVRDRRPLLGAANRENVFHFNGMGTRGVLNAPLLAGWMSAYLMTGAALSEEVCVDRFNDLR